MITDPLNQKLEEGENETPLPPALDATPPVSTVILDQTSDDAEIADSARSQPTLEEVGYVEKPTKSTLNITDLPFRAFKATDRRDIGVLSLLYGTMDSTVAHLKAQSDASITDPEKYANWGDAVEDSYTHYYRTLKNGGAFEETVTREGGDWGQGIQVEDTRYAARQQRLPVENGEKLTGVNAITKVIRAMGMGAIVQVPLWHTGIWVSIKAPSDVELYELERRIANEKIKLGRMTKGLVFSNTSVYIAAHVINFVFDHVYSTTAVRDTPDYLKTICRTTDIPSLVWGLCAAIYPNGYPYRQPCTVGIAKCNHVEEAIIDIGKLQWVDRSMLSDKQKRHMVNRNTRSTDEQITAYQAEFDSSSKKSNFKLNAAMTIELGTPSIAEYEQSGFSWIEGIQRETDEAFGTTLEGSERDDYITDVARTTAARQYSHWVKAIEIVDEKGITSRIEDRGAIEVSSVQISSNDILKSVFVRGIGDYIDAITVCTIGYVNYACPACGELQLKGNGEHTRIVPIDMMSVFLTLQRHKIDQALKDQTSI